MVVGGGDMTWPHSCFLETCTCMQLQHRVGNKQTYWVENKKLTADLGTNSAVVRRKE